MIKKWNAYLTWKCNKTKWNAHFLYKAINFFEKCILYTGYNALEIFSKASILLFRTHYEYSCSITGRSEKRSLCWIRGHLMMWYITELHWNCGSVGECRSLCNLRNKERWIANSGYSDTSCVLPHSSAACYRSVNKSTCSCFTLITTSNVGFIYLNNFQVLSPPHTHSHLGSHSQSLRDLEDLVIDLVVIIVYYLVV